MLVLHAFVGTFILGLFLYRRSRPSASELDPEAVHVPVSLHLAGLTVISGPRLFWFPLVFFVVTFVVVDTIPDLLIRPYVSGQNLHVGAVMFAYIFSPLLFGWYGLFLGPLLLVAITDFARVVIPNLVESSPSPAATSLTGVQIGDGSERRRSTITLMTPTTSPKPTTRTEPAIPHG